MSEEWIFRCWDYRDDVAVSANDEHLVMSDELLSQLQLHLDSVCVLYFH